MPYNKYEVQHGIITIQWTTLIFDKISSYLKITNDPRQALEPWYSLLSDLYDRSPKEYDGYIKNVSHEFTDSVQTTRIECYIIESKSSITTNIVKEKAILNAVTSYIERFPFMNLQEISIVFE